MRMVSFLLVVAFIVGATGCGNAKSIKTSASTSESAGVSESTAVSEASFAASAEDTDESVNEASAVEEAPLDSEWAVEAPEEHGVDTTLLAQIDGKMAGSQMLAAVIVKDGVIIDEFYKDGYDENSLFGMHSVTKSVMGTLIGIAIEQGVLEGVDVKLADFFPQLAEPDNAGKETITVEQLLTHTAGLGEGDSESFQSLMHAENWVDYYLSQRLNYEPGTTFNYSTAGSHMLSAVLEQASGRSTEEFAVEHLFGPLGIESYEWGTDPQGIADGGNGLHLRVRDAAKIGQLYLEGGNWRGNQIIPQDWITQSTSVHAKGESDKGQYGYQWWIWTFGGHDVYYALGYAGQFIFVVPDLNLVTAIASESIWSDFTGQVCIRDVIAACEKGDIK